MQSGTEDSAADNGGVYFGIRGGGSWMEQSGGASTYSTNATGVTPSTSYSFDDSGYAFGATVGWNWADSDLPLRTEFEYMYHVDYADKFSTSHNSTEFSYSNEIDIHTAFINVSWDIYDFKGFTPFLTAGVGLAVIKEDFKATNLTLSKGSSTTTNLAYNIGAGTSYSFTENILMDVMYRYESYGNTSSGVTGSRTSGGVNSSLTVNRLKNLATHNLYMGLRYQF